MYKIAVVGDYDSIYGFATLGLTVCPVRTLEEAKQKLWQLAEENAESFILQRHWRQS